MAQIQFDLTRAEEITRYQFRDRGLLYEALQSATRDRDELTGEIHESDGNRRLAKLGFVVLELAVVDEWFRRGMSHRALRSTLTALLSRYADEDQEILTCCERNSWPRTTCPMLRSRRRCIPACQCLSGRKTLLLPRRP